MVHSRAAGIRLVELTKSPQQLSRKARSLRHNSDFLDHRYNRQCLLRSTRNLYRRKSCAQKWRGFGRVVPNPTMSQPSDQRQRIHIYLPPLRPAKYKKRKICQRPNCERGSNMVNHQKVVSKTAELRRVKNGYNSAVARTHLVPPFLCVTVHSRRRPEHKLACKVWADVRKKLLLVRIVPV